MATAPPATSATPPPWAPTQTPPSGPAASARTKGEGRPADPLEAALVQPHQTAAIEADPQVAVGRLEQGPHLDRLESRGVGRLEKLEAEAVEAQEPAGGADPEVAVAGLRRSRKRFWR